MNVIRLPYPVVASLGLASGAYFNKLFIHRDGLFFWLTIAGVFISLALSLLPVVKAGFRRLAIAILFAGFGVWLAMVPLVMELQWHLPFEKQGIKQLQGTVVDDSRLSQSGKRWFVLDLDYALDAVGNREPANGRVHVLFPDSLEVLSGQRLSVYGSFLDGGEWFSASKLLVDGYRNSYFRLRGQLRKRFLGELRVLPASSAVLLEALLAGSLDSMPINTRRIFRENGLMHVLALSGMHIGIMAALPVFFFRRLFGLRPALIFTAILLGCYVLLVGPRASLLRAAFFFLFTGVWILARRRPWNIVILAQCFLVLSFFVPSLLDDVGFQLSFLTLAGIMVFSPSLMALFGGALPEPGRLVYGPIAAGVAASLAGLPLSMLLWGMWYPQGILLTVIVVPLAMLVMYLGLALLAAYLCMLPWQFLIPLEHLIELVSRILVGVLETTSGLGAIDLHGLTGRALVLVLVTIMVLLAWRHARLKRYYCEVSCITVN